VLRFAGRGGLFLRRARDRQRGLRSGGCRLGPSGRCAAGRAGDEGRASVLQLGQGTGWHPGRIRGRRLTRAARGGRLEVLPRNGRPRAGGDPHRRGPVGDPLARRARRRVHARERRLPPCPLRWRITQAALAGRRPHGTRHHDGVARLRRELRRSDLSQVTARRPRPDRERLARTLRGSHDRRHDGGPRSGRAVLPRRRGAR
jgi:hypothetical protein